MGEGKEREGETSTGWMQVGLSRRSDKVGDLADCHHWAIFLLHHFPSRPKEYFFSQCQVWALF